MQSHAEQTPEKPGLIFLMRRKPQGKGGIQTQGAHLADGLGRFFELEYITWEGALWASLFFTPAFYHRSVRSRAPLVHCDDALTSIIGHGIRSKTGKKVVATAHGRDVTMPVPAYQFMLRRSLTSMDAVVCVSRATAREVINRGVDPGRVEIIANSVEADIEPREKDESLYQEVQQLTGIDIRGRKVLFSLGRPIKRKGFDYFLSMVFPHLPDDYLYIVAGPATKKPAYAGTLARLVGDRRCELMMMAIDKDTVHERLLEMSRQPRVHYLNNVSNWLRNLLYYASDLFIMPNRRVKGDMEGFGLVALEAAVRGVPVVATGIEGITDAVIHGKNGYCVPEGDPEAMARTITALLENRASLTEFGKKAARFTRERFSIEKIIGQYRSLFSYLLRS
jgi:phosphatidylinositol alpha-1,6-mannosyltransferase